jgi:competence protein ComEA
MFKLLRIVTLALMLSPLALAAATPVDINTADAATLEQVRGIGPSRAAAIIQYRTENGPFKAVDELMRVPGIGEKSLTQLRDQLTVGTSAGKK